MNIRKAKKEDLTQIMEIIRQAQASLKELGISQWQDGYPNETTILADIEQESSYILEENHKILATAVIAFDEEPTYQTIYLGAWRSTKNYAVIHRVAVDHSCKKQGLAKQLIAYAIHLCNENLYEWIRVDTHEGNIPMQRFLEKQGFQSCGIIYLSSEHNDETKRLAYDYQIL